MVRGPESAEQDYGDGVQPVDLERIKHGIDLESDPANSKKAINEWEKKNFGDVGDDEIDEENIFRLYQ